MEGSSRRPSMASPIPNETAVDKYVVTDVDFECLQNFDWSSVSAEILNDLEFITKLPVTPVLEYESLGALLPEKSADAPAKTLFIDLDETLVHTALGPPSPTSENLRHDLSFVSDTDGSVQARVYFRPWIMDFLQIMSQYYELILYTASVKLYADIIVDELDCNGLIRYRLYREHCTQYGESDIYFKDLNGTGRDLKDSVVMDNRLISFGLNVSNGIFVSSFTGQPNDTELLQLIPILVALSKQQDVRVALAETYKLPTIVQRYRQDINAEVAKKLTNIGSPRAHRVDNTTSLHTHAIQTLGSLAALDEDEEENIGRVAREDEDDDDDSEREEDFVTEPNPQAYHVAESSTSGSEDDTTLDIGSPRIHAYRSNIPPKNERPAGGISLLEQLPPRESSPQESSSSRQASSTRHVQALGRISLTRETAGVPPQYKLLMKTQRQASLRRLVLPPLSPERKRKQSNPFKQISRVSIAVNRRPVAPKSLYH